ncbi:MAG: carbamate kinase, partial [Dehalococcoidales bacterium]|nr:carbamate kinase [Dehalococcoidales bacterium]
EVDPLDSALRKPSKPVGPFRSADEARERMNRGETWVEDAGRGWRRVVPSPKPLAIIEAAAIARLHDAGAVVIAAGGGGVPVVRKDGALVGVEAVIDKDLAAARLAEQLGMEVLLILTDVEGVALDFGRPEQRFLGRVSAADLERLLRRGKFPAGSMRPKVQAAVEFLRVGGQRAVICSLGAAVQGLAGDAGTQVVGEPRARRAA